jgi:hypothetical protein
MSAWKTDSCDKLRQGDVHGSLKNQHSGVNEKSLSLQVLFKKKQRRPFAPLYIKLLCLRLGGVFNN